MKLMRHLIPPALLLPIVAAAPAAAQSVRLPAPGGAVVSADAAQHSFHYGEWHFAPARVDGEHVHLSGIVAGAPASWPAGQALDTMALEAAFRRLFTRIDQLLAAAGSDGRHIVEMTSYHLFASPLVAGGKAEHIAVFRRIKDEFVKEPYPAWTAIGVAELIPERAPVEVRVMARLKRPA